ncbi:MAG: hypothetical protein MUC36_22900 [Planctomycetes bacterium]|jgi:hypothetical protein|nr:hypothetical protein [Planctomycetota bacterium]
MIAEAQFLPLLGSLAATAAPQPAERGGLLAAMLRPFAGRPNVFVTDGERVTTVLVHKTESLDLELRIVAATKQWSVAVRDVSTGRALVGDRRLYQQSHATVAEQRQALLDDVRAFLGAIVDAPVRMTGGAHPQLQTRTVNGWRRALPLTH